MYEFIENCRPDHLTLDDVIKWKIGQVTDVVIWDYNFAESWIKYGAIADKHYKPAEFFRYNRRQLVYLGDMMWKIIYPSISFEIEHPIHINVSEYDNKRKWLPLGDDNKIHIMEGNDGTTKDVTMHWSEFPRDTAVGWRGPVMPWDHLQKYGDVYVTKHFIVSDK